MLSSSHVSHILCLRHKANTRVSVDDALSLYVCFWNAAYANVSVNSRSCCCVCVYTHSVCVAPYLQANFSSWALLSAGGFVCRRPLAFPRLKRLQTAPSAERFPPTSFNTAFKTCECVSIKSQKHVSASTSLIMVTFEERAVLLDDESLFCPLWRFPLSKQTKTWLEPTERLAQQTHHSVIVQEALK